jgi:outer membrane protein, heavy metal efflux system
LLQVFFHNKSKGNYFMYKYGSYASWRAAGYFIFITLLAFFIDLPTVKSARAVAQTQGEPLIRLADLEQMALQGNPTLAQAEAAVRAAEGRRVQAGLFPNPIMGYSGEELALRAIGQKSEHLFFFEQSIPLGGKLKKSRNIVVQEKGQAEQEMAAQRQRILNAVRILYYEALGAQQLVEVREMLARLAGEAVGVTGDLFNVGQADRPDLFQIEIEAQKAQLDLIVAENERDQVWQQLGAVVGNPFLKRSRLMGDLERDLPVIDQEAMLAKILKESPEILRARAGAERARAAVTRAKAEPIPDLFVRMAFGYNLEQLDSAIIFTGRRTGPEGQLEVGMRVPIFNRNQGAIAAAGAEVDAAEREVRRVELMLRARFASALRSYQNALRVTTQYEKQIIPRAQQAYDMYLGSFKQMAAAYPQVLIAQRTFFQVRADYIKALVDAWQNATRMQGYLLMGGLVAPGDAGEQ